MRRPTNRKLPQEESKSGNDGNHGDATMLLHVSADPGLVHPRLADPEPADSRLAGSRPADSRPADHRPTHHRPADLRPAMRHTGAIFVGELFYVGTLKHIFTLATLLILAM